MTGRSGAAEDRSLAAAVGLVVLAVFLTPVSALGLFVLTMFPTVAVLPIGLAVVQLVVVCLLTWTAAVDRAARHRGWLLLVLAVISTAGVLLVGAPWLPQLGSLGLGVLIVLRPPWSIVVFGALLVAPIPLAAAYGDIANWELDVSGVSKAVACYALLVAVVAARRLRATRGLLVAQAVRAERVRVDDELRAAVTGRLARVVTRGARAVAGLDSADARRRERAGEELRELVDESRLCLSETRRVLIGFRTGSLHGEVGTATALLRAGGVAARIELVDPAPAASDRDRDAVRAALRATVTRLLRDGGPGPCRIVVVASGPGAGAHVLPLAGDPVGTVGS